MFCNAISLWIGVTLWTLLKSNYTIYSLWACFNPSLCWLFLFRFSCHFHFWAIVRSASVINLRVRIAWAFWIIHMFCSKSPIYFPTLCFRLWLIHRFNSIDKNCMCCLESIAHSDTFCDHVNFSCAGDPVCVYYVCVCTFFFILKHKIDHSDTRIRLCIRLYQCIIRCLFVLCLYNLIHRWVDLLAMPQSVRRLWNVVLSAFEIKTKWKWTKQGKSEIYL